MYSKFLIKDFSISNYRNHKKIGFQSNKDIVYLYGKNGSGKTNILEAISLLSCPNGFRNSKLISLLSEKDPHIYHNFSVNLTLINDDKEMRIGIGLLKNPNGIKKVIKVNGEQINHNKFYDEFKTFWLLPLMNNLFNGSSLERRNFIDQLIINLDSNHRKNINIYNKLQKERLSILKNFRGKSYNNNWLDLIEKKMAPIGVVICETRKNFMKKINFFSQKKKEGFPILKFNLNGELDKCLESNPALFVEERFIEKLYKNRKTDSLIGRTHFGVNKTDIIIYNNSKNQFASECSTGEQKVILISMILSFFQILKMEKTYRIICLMDDVFAYLDEKHIDIILEELDNLKIQTWITNVTKKIITEKNRYYDRILFLNIKDIKV